MFDTSVRHFKNENSLKYSCKHIFKHLNNLNLYHNEFLAHLLCSNIFLIWSVECLTKKKRLAVAFLTILWIETQLTIK